MPMIRSTGKLLAIDAKVNHALGFFTFQPQ
jgi:hypothetical protein